MSPFGESTNDKPLTGNIGLFYVCYRLSLCGWNTLPTIRNARGVDVILMKGEKKLGVQVKTLSKENDVFLDKNHDDPVVDFWIVLMNARRSDKPNAYVIPRKDIENGVRRCEEGENSRNNLIYHDNIKEDGKISYHINKNFLKGAEHSYREAWETIE